MSVKKVHYEELLAEYSNATEAITLLKRYRPYLELMPSMRRPIESVITLPLPIVKLRRSTAALTSDREAARLPCEVALLMCDPEWKIKTGIEVFIFIHRPDEDFSDLLGRWRETQVLLSQEYEWEMPMRYRQIMAEGADRLYPLFVVFEETPERIKRGLKGAFLPFVTHAIATEGDTAQDESELSETELLWSDSQDDNSLS